MHVSRCDFHDAFHGYDRKDQFSVDGRNALFDYLESYADDTGEDVQLDVIALCCEWSEYPTALEAAKEYGFTHEPDDDADADDAERAALAWLQYRTTVLESDSSVVIQQF
jgi:hypothetical protein